MSKKVIAILGLAAVIAVSTGVITMTGRHQRGADGDPVGGDPTQSVDVSVDITDDGGTDDAEYNDDVTEDASEPELPTDDQPVYASDGSDADGYAKDIVSVDSFKVVRIYDRAADSDVTAREVFGKLYYECYLSFGSDGSFELLLNPVADEVRKGTYKVYGDVISVVYSDGGGSEFNIITDDSGGVDYILVSYGDYDVYFG